MSNQRGVQEQKEGGKTYIAVSNGIYVNRVKEETKTSKARLLEKGPNAGKEVHEERFSSFVGALNSCKVDETGDYGASWELIIDVTPGPEDPEELFALKLKYDSGYAADILKRLPNIDLDKDILFTSYCFTPKGEEKVRMGLGMSQEDTNGKWSKVMPFYTKDTPNDLPQGTRPTK